MLCSHLFEFFHILENENSQSQLLVDQSYVEFVETSRALEGECANNHKDHFWKHKTTDCFVPELLVEFFIKVKCLRKKSARNTCVTLQLRSCAEYLGHKHKASSMKHVRDPCKIAVYRDFGYITYRAKRQSDVLGSTTPSRSSKRTPLIPSRLY